jgi:hypothetical protein
MYDVSRYVMFDGYTFDIHLVIQRLQSRNAVLGFLPYIGTTVTVADVVWHS